MTVIGFAFSVWAAVIVAAAVLLPVAVAAGVVAYGRAKRRALHRRLLFDAQWEHAALMDGDLAVGIHGRYREGVVTPGARTVPTVDFECRRYREAAAIGAKLANRSIWHGRRVTR